MLSLLLNWRVLAGLAIVIAQAVFGTVMYKEGEKNVQVVFDEYKNQQILDTLAAESAVRQKEHVLISANQKVSQDYETLKASTRISISSLDSERLRLQSLLNSSSNSSSSDAGTIARANDSAKDNILAGCLAKYESLAGDAQSTADTLIELQKYVNDVVKSQ
jgi:Protein of unknown function (DUF2514)